MVTSTFKILGYSCLLVLLAGGIAGSVWCFWSHLCMGGHMEHTPYPTIHYIAYVAWSMALVAVPTMSWVLRLFGRFWWITTVALALPIYRFGFDSLCGRGVLGLPL
jgi:hypothetical protein